MDCRHCGAREATRARGLCGPCHYRPAIRVLYPYRRPPACVQCGRSQTYRAADRHPSGLCRQCRGEDQAGDWARGRRAREAAGLAPSVDPALPIAARPGTAEAMAALMRRVEAGLPLCRAGDAGHRNRARG